MSIGAIVFELGVIQVLRKGGCVYAQALRSVTSSVSDLAKTVAGHQGLQLQKVVGPDEKL